MMKKMVKIVVEEMVEIMHVVEKMAKIMVKEIVKMIKKWYQRALWTQRRRGVQ